MRTILLDRPQALHSLSIAMVDSMMAALTTWQNALSPSQIVLIRGADTIPGKKVFCAGGDVVSTHTTIYNKIFTWIKIGPFLFCFGGCSHYQVAEFSRWNQKPHSFLVNRVRPESFYRYLLKAHRSLP